MHTVKYIDNGNVNDNNIDNDNVNNSNIIDDNVNDENTNENKISNDSVGNFNVDVQRDQGSPRLPWSWPPQWLSLQLVCVAANTVLVATAVVTS